MRSPSAHVRILYIAGAGRNGSTLLDKVLGQHPEVFAGGELARLWDRGLAQRRMCGCGRLVPECPTWRAILDPVLPDLDGETVAETARKLAAATRTRRLLGVAGDVSLDPLRGQLSALYRGVAQQSRATVVVDSSKTPAYVRLLQSTPGLDVRIVHLVRDPRAVAYSWQRGKLQVDEGLPRPMNTAGPIRVGVGWTAWNLVLDRSRRLDPSGTRLLRYEDFAAAPRSVADELIAWILPDSGSRLPFLDEHTVLLEPTHSVSGNPSRFQHGSVTIEADERWRAKLPTRDRRLVAAVTWPLARRYGY